MCFVKSTHIRSADAVEEQDLEYHDEGRDSVQVEDDEGSEPAFTEEITD